MKTLIAAKPLVYASRTLAAGDEFRVANAHVRMLVAAGLAREPVPAPAALKPAEPVRRAYRRRDMRAEDE